MALDGLRAELNAAAQAAADTGIDETLFLVTYVHAWHPSVFAAVTAHIPEKPAGGSCTSSRRRHER